MEDVTAQRTNQNTGTEVIGVAKRRAFTAAYKRRIVEEASRARAGEIGLILRREGLYFSQLARWRAARSGMASKKKKSEGSVNLAAYRLLEKENARLKLKLRRAEAMLELQKKAAEILGYDDEKEESNS
jgi:transposase-like protein